MEYKDLKVFGQPSGGFDLAELNQLGNEGWRVVGASLTITNKKMWFLLLERGSPTLVRVAPGPEPSIAAINEPYDIPELE